MPCDNCSGVYRDRLGPPRMGVEPFYKNTCPYCHKKLPLSPKGNNLKAKSQEVSDKPRESRKVTNRKERELISRFKLTYQNREELEKPSHIAKELASRVRRKLREGSNE